MYSLFYLIFCWSVVNLQCSVSFRCIAQWFSYKYIYIIYIYIHIYIYLGFPGSSDTKESACNVGHPGSISILGLKRGRSPGEENGNPLQYSCMENSKDRGVCQATVCGLQRVSRDWESNAHTYIYIYICNIYIIYIYYFQILFLYRLLQDIEYSSLCYIVGPGWLFYI